MKELAMRMNLLFLAISSALLWAGCAREPKLVRIAEWEQYQDPYFAVTFSYPKGWHVVTEAGKVSVYSSTEAVQKFYDPTSKSEPGVQLVITYEKLDTLRSLDEYVASYTAGLTGSGFVIKSIQSKSVDDTPGSEVSYSGRFDERTKLESDRVFAFKDSMRYQFSYAAFNELYPAYRSVFDSLLASVVLPNLRSTSGEAEITGPSTEFKSFVNNLLELSYPGNFDYTFPQPKGEVEFSLELKGYRQDCTVRIDVLPAKGLTVEKVFEQNSRFFSAISQGEATIGRLKGLYVTYSPAKNIESRAYFLVKNDKVYRIIINYFAPEKNIYLPAFEKTVASLRVK